VASPSNKNATPKRGPGDPWFRINTLDVTTSVLIPGLIVIVWIAAAVNGSILGVLWLSRASYRSGFLWQLVTWPFAGLASVPAALGLFFFWSFGRLIEQQLGPSRYLRFLAVIGVLTGFAALLIDLVVQDFGAIRHIGEGSILPVMKGVAATGYFPILFEPRLLALGVAVCVAAEFPSIRTFFGIPIRILVGVFVGIEVLQTLGDRYWVHLIHMFVAMSVGLIALRSFGLGTELPSWIPHVRLPRLITGDPYASAQRRGATVSSKSKGAKTGTSRFGRGSGSGKVVSGPWGESGTGSASPAAASPSSAPTMNRNDREEVDRLLDKIAKDGMTSLTTDERAQLEAASRRLRENGQR
jgi:membrane associated rhomboid family serine protease